MTRTPLWRRYLRFWGPDVKADVDIELTFHLDMRTQELIDRGWPPAEARAEAMRCFGDRDAVATACRAEGERHERQRRLRRFLDEVRQDLTFALRLFRRTPGFAAVAVLTLALGIGANAAVFSVAEAVLVRPLPYDRPEQLVVVWGQFDKLGVPRNPLSEPEYWDLRDSTRSFDQLAAVYSRGGGNLTIAGGEPQRVTTLAATTGLFPLLGVQPVLGRSFHAQEDQPDTARVAMLGEGFWRSRMAADPKVLGKTIRIDSVPFEVIGIVPESFRLPGRYDVYTPLGLNRLQPFPREEHGLIVVGRLTANATLAGANAELRSLAARLAKQYSGWYSPDSGWDLYAVSLYQAMVGGSRLALLSMLAAAGFVLLIASANVTNLLLARASGRAQELAIRRALGAGRARLLRQTLTEGVLLGTMGGALALIMVWWCAGVVRGLEPAGLPRLDEVRIDATVLVYTVAVSLGLGVLSSLLPSLRLAGGRRSASLALPAAGRSELSTSGRARSVLVVAQIALALVLLVGSSLMIRTVWHLWNTDTGFDMRRVLTFQVSLPQRLYDTRASIAGFYERALERLARVPGVEAVGTISGLPLGAPGGSGTVFIENTPVTGLPRSQALSLPMIEADRRAVSPRYMQTMRMRLLRGRFFDEQDHGSAALVAIVDSSLASRVWPGLDPIGRRVAVDSTEGPNGPVMRWRTVVGVVGHVRQEGLDVVGREQVYMPVYQRLSTEPAFVLRTTGDAASLVPAIRREIAAVDGGLPLYDVRTMEAIVGGAIRSRVWMATLLATLALLALALAVGGTYAVMACAVGGRVHEIGVRMALGAGRLQVLGLVLRRGLVLIALGGAVGFALALGLMRAMTGLIVGVSTVDPTSLAAALAVLATPALLAAYLPARRATRIDPLAALREL